MVYPPHILCEKVLSDTFSIQRPVIQMFSKRKYVNRQIFIYRTICYPEHNIYEYMLAIISYPKLFLN